MHEIQEILANANKRLTLDLVEGKLVIMYVQNEILLLLSLKSTQIKLPVPVCSSGTVANALPPSHRCCLVAALVFNHSAAY